jgi:carbamoyl-phosphate synthase large subunit
VKVLVLGAGGAASNGFCRALRLAGGYELVGTNSSETDLWLSECETNHVISPVSDEARWRNDLRLVIDAEKPAFIHAQHDGEVAALGRFRNVAHGLGCKTFLPDQSVIELCQDKWLSYEKWRDFGITVAGCGVVNYWVGEAWARVASSAYWCWRPEVVCRHLL